MVLAYEIRKKERKKSNSLIQYNTKTAFIGYI